MDSEEAFSKLVDLFDAIDITEKGIEIVYNYLLLNQIIKDPKSISETLGLSLKRIYKIFSVLKDLGLVQVYSRPMKVTLTDPITSWEKIISEKIKEIRLDSDKRISRCENNLSLMIETYNLLPQQPSLPPVEYISLSNEKEIIDIITHEVFNSCSEVFITKGLRVDFSFYDKIYNKFEGKKIISPELKSQITNILTHFENIQFKALISEDYIDEYVNRLETFSFDKMDQLETLNKFISSIEIKISKNTIGNFIIKEDTELMQYSVDPSNKVLGLFVSRQKEIIDVFMNKFNELYSKSIDLPTYFNKIKKKIKPIDILFYLFL